MNKIKLLWTSWTASLWFAPSVMVCAAIVLAVATLKIDASISFDLANRFPNLFGAGADGSRAMLSTIAGSIITVAGLTFTLTITALAQASNQYTSRILRNFMSDRVNQRALGFFVGLFVYCLIVLRTIRGGDENKFVPYLSVVAAFLLALVGIGVLIYFFHHIAASIQASNIISAVTNETFKAVDKLFPN